jgi:hypothetical protein
MRTFLIVGVFALTSCTTTQTASVGERADAAASLVETSLCPLVTFRNLEGAVIRAVQVVPFFTDWQSVCATPTD